VITHSRIVAAALSSLLALGAVTPAAATLSAKISEEDAAIFEAGLLTVDDLPAGFTSSGPDQSARRPDTSGFADPRPACRKIYPGLAKSARAALQALSEDFVDETTDAESFGTVRVYKGEKAAATYLDRVSSSEFLGCFRAGEEEQATQASDGSSEETRVVSPLTDLPDLGGDEVSGLRNVITTASEGAPPDVYVIDYYYVRVGRAVLYLAFGNAQEPLPGAVEVVRTVATRVASTEQ